MEFKPGYRTLHCDYLHFHKATEGLCVVRTLDQGFRVLVDEAGSVCDAASDMYFLLVVKASVVGCCF